MDWFLPDLLVAIVVLGVPLGTTLLVLRYLNNRDLRRREVQRDLISRMAGAELLERLDTEAGREFIARVLLGDGLPHEAAVARRRHGWILLVLGLATAASGGVLFAMGAHGRDALGVPVDGTLLACGIIVAGLGAGLLLADLGEHQGGGRS